mmetsp:Transcript_85947/g.165453  ORF Transcript_85947/g.165453 Transcript_85947/m.165453 type:complete len:605 (+) Transcript_85947:64-1878(+)
MTQRLQRAGQSALVARAGTSEAVAAPHRSRSSLIGHDLQQRSAQRQQSSALRHARASTPREARAAKNDGTVTASRQGVQLHDSRRASRHGLSNQIRPASGSRTPARRSVMARPMSGSRRVATEPAGADTTPRQSRWSVSTHCERNIPTPISPIGETLRKHNNVLPCMRSGSDVLHSRVEALFAAPLLEVASAGEYLQQCNSQPETSELTCAATPALVPATFKDANADLLCVPIDEWRSARDWFEALFGFREQSYAETRRRLKATHDRDGFWSLQGENGVRYKAGQFTTPNLSELELEAVKLGGMGALPGRVTVRNVKGDVAMFHSQFKNRHATFQVASQFNCLEFPGPYVTPEDGITSYVCDRTQGPACSVACGPATALRNYFVEAGGESGQTCDRQVENLQGILAQLGHAGKHITVRNGYTFAADNGLMVVKGVLQDSTSLQKSCQQELRVGVHKDVQVTSSGWGLCQQHDSDQTVTQVFGSACSIAYSAGNTEMWAAFARLVLRASFEAALWVGLLSALRHDGHAGSRRVFLTCLGGGVFGNPMSWIVEAMQAALEKFAHVNLEIFIITYSGPVPDELEDLERRFGSGSTGDASRTLGTRRW